jgi:HSP20 family molecular chaperone IbpA
MTPVSGTFILQIRDISLVSVVPILFGIVIVHSSDLPVISIDTYIENNNNRPCNQVDQHLGNKKRGGRQMVRHYRRSIYDELDDLRASMDYLFQLVLEPIDTPLLPVGETPDPVSLYPPLLDAEVTELDDEVIVTVNLIPGVNNSVFSCGLINEKTLKISCDRQEVKTVEHEGYSMTEERFCSLHRDIPLPSMVTNKGAKSTLKNGVLDIHLMKAQPR